MKCPFCADPNTQVTDTRENEDGDVVRRRRRCVKCDKRFTTYERIDLKMPHIVKRNGQRGFLGEFGGSADPACLDGLARMTALVDRENAVWTGWTYWAAGDWWPADEPLNIQPTADGDRPQLAALVAGGGLSAKP